ncbi:MAG: acyl-CoA synthetase [Paucimonas sp.]|jgi:acyl-coenzyme A synthetase/AMP-(fatty) acid ligase|nr:acyl-CoA synthetase [Paucimonas sp.]
MPIMSTFPLITHSSGDSTIAWRQGRQVKAAEYLADVAVLAKSLPAGRHVLNSCADRYRFMVGLGAALVTGRISLLPSTQTPEMIRHIREFATDTFCLTDNGATSIDLPTVRFQERETSSSPESFSVPLIDADQLVAYVFTSGSTGAPVPHAKTWGALVRNVQGAAQLWQVDDGRTYSIIGTVPPQHMYGFESTVLIVMQSANSMVSEKTFYPADIAGATASAPQPRVLVTTPVHLRALLQAGVDIPSADLVVSATAPLSEQLAAGAERAFQAPLIEIYGCTETGQIAVRRSTRTREWQLFRDVRLEKADGVTWAAGGHVEKATALSDVIDVVDSEHFLLHGRLADLVNIAGKRNSLAYLNLQLNAIDGVRDGAFFVPDDADVNDVARLAAFVVAPDLNAAQILAALRERIDPVFLPRPLHFVEALPRNGTGKLPREALARLAADLAGHACGGNR